MGDVGDRFWVIEKFRPELYDWPNYSALALLLVCASLAYAANKEVVVAYAAITLLALNQQTPWPIYRDVRVLTCTGMYTLLVTWRWLDAEETPPQSAKERMVHTANTTTRNSGVGLGPAGTSTGTTSATGSIEGTVAG
jgi:hypothetical protein